MNNSYENFVKLVDACDNIEELKSFRNGNRAVSMRDEFWKQREIALTSDNPLEKEKALTKAQWLQYYFSSTVPISKKINKFSAPHGLYGIFISTRASIGKNCVIYQHVTIGSNTLVDSKNAGFPVVGNHVFIGTGAKIIGNVTIGDYARIGANCCVTVDVPSNSLVIGEKARIIPRDKQNDNSFLSPEKFAEQRYKIVYDYCRTSMESDLQIEKGTLEEIDNILQLYREKIAFLRWKRISQWNNYLLNHPEEEFLRSIIAKEYYIIRKTDKIVAGFKLSEESENWMDDNSKAIYLSRVVTLPGCRNIGDYILLQVKKIAKDMGKDLIRLECVFNNQRLNEIWQSHGFTFIQDGQSNYHYALYEYRL